MKLTKKPLIALIAGGVAATSLGLGGYASAMTKDITLTVDGQAAEVSVWGRTVADALSAHDIELTRHDEVSPAADTAIADGSVVNV
ncbi:MAG: ubiquitin-like domain-containing protein, partial [Brooklawnia sp.]